MEAPLKAEGSAPRPARPFAGVVANIAGFGDATEPGAVGRAVTMVYMFCCIPFGLAALLMLRFVRITLGEPVLAGERRNVSSASP
jgi:hypothetical protein